MRLCSIASGSSGNCIYVGTDTTHLLVDVGISGKRIEEGLNKLSLSGRDIKGILITHEHSDHISGLGVILRKYNIPVYASYGTIMAIKDNDGKIDESLLVPIDADKKVLIGDMYVHAARIPHDAREPYAYRFSDGSKKVGIMTDMGTYDDYIVESFKGMDALLIEANHDVRMLQVGPYPYYLKQRILGNKGHLSNEASGRLLSNLLNDDMQHILLGHLSKENNLAELAYETVRLEIENADNEYRANDFDIKVAGRNQLSDIINI